jgi:hypothetical protein
MNDYAILDLIARGRLRVDTTSGSVYALRSNTPEKPCGALTKKGYLRICVNDVGRQRHFMAHRIVWVAAHGPVPDGHTIDHLNTVKTDNRLVNLEAVPGLENTRRAVLVGAYVGVGRRDGIRDSKGRFGRKLDGRTHDGYPAPAGASS